MRGPRAEGGGATPDVRYTLLRLPPPLLLQTGKIKRRPEPGELAWGCAEVAGVDAALAHQRLDADLQIERLADDRGCLQGAPVRARDQAHDACRRKLLHQPQRLPPARRGQRRLGDAGIDPGLREVMVPLRFRMPDQDHERRFQPPRGGGMRRRSCSTASGGSGETSSNSASIVGGAPPSGRPGLTPWPATRTSRWWRTCR
jgi:hypothetical protein